MIKRLNIIMYLKKTHIVYFPLRISSRRSVRREHTIWKYKATGAWEFTIMLKKRQGRCPERGFIENLGSSVAQQSDDGECCQRKKIPWVRRDLQHWRFHLSFILIVISRCDVGRYILIGTGSEMRGSAAAVTRPPRRLLLTKTFLTLHYKQPH